ncbi:MAG: hypothetical protein LBP93_08490, partial [Treponema sp.]|nr:hypothetical protein [Treponema sp.]
MRWVKVEWGRSSPVTGGGSQAELVVGRGGAQDAPEDPHPVVAAGILPLGFDRPDAGQFDEVHPGVGNVRLGLGLGPGDGGGGVREVEAHLLPVVVGYRGV